MADQVTHGGVALLLSDVGDKVCLQVTKMEQASATRMKLELSDGKAKVNAVTSSDFNTVAQEAKLEKYGVVMLTKYNILEQGGEKKVIVVEGSVVEAQLNEEVCEKPALVTPTFKREAKRSTGESASPPSAAKIGSIRTASNTRRVQPIGALNPYANSWTIKARVTSKGEPRSFNSNGQQRNLLNIELIDEEGTEIRCTLWHESVEKYGADIQQGKAYYISKGRLKPANQKYSTLANAYELHFSADTTVEEVPEGEMAAVKVAYSFVGFENLGAQIGSRAPFDVVGVVQAAGELGTVKRKSDGGELFRRDLTLLDANSKTVTMTVWNKLATDETAELPSLVASGTTVVAIKGVRASDYNGVSLSTLGRTVVSINPKELPEAEALREWFEAGGKSAPTVAAGAGLASANKGSRSDTSLTCLKDLQPEELAAASAPPEYFSSLATVVRFATQRAMWYTACPEGGCNKKVTEEMGSWYCEAHQQSFPNCKRRYIASMQVMDHSGTAWVNTFNEQAELALGISADEAHEMQEQDQAAFQAHVKSKSWQTFSLRVRSKTEEYQGESRRRLTAANANAMDWGMESRRMLAAIKAL
mmetsp:Transcript_39697/g.86448  ORF Transcript_39697/g.86448 Transcript_39697/m.86448 type:complete len:589 (-) Transcript_39697:400-2166(-)|eukprot:CAMPEP_0118923102 /NCGR_PEP_ID=MMETSP1169-20130426/1757_1 /TAXON_ID=36882 /ORGANISM="Pyramimonas obovata, Strain CCMP722" /LENGTH=588 /DNA_ID=CAMNT_0006864045 /DNA_START=125 /DNA_END=1891 /DNA_ORIENTATION=-